MTNQQNKNFFDEVAFRNFFSKQMAVFSIPGASLTISINGKEHTFTGGVTEVHTGSPVTPNTLFQIASITKLLTTTLVIQEVETGNIRLDDPVVSYLETLRLGDASYPNEITVRHLLSHCTGHPGDFFLDARTDSGTLIKLVDQFDQLTALWPAGKVFSYCNAAFVLLGSILEKITGQDWDNLVRTRIFQPLGMQHSVTEIDEMANYNMAVGHNFDGTALTNEPVAEPFLALSNKSAGSTLSASSSDLARFGIAFTQQGQRKASAKILSSESMRKLFSTEISVTPESFKDISGFGLGWMLFDEGKQTFFGHNGSTPGQESYLRIIPDKNFVFSLLTNGGDRYGFFRFLLDRVSKETLGINIRQCHDWKLNDDYDQTTYVGSYEDFSFRVNIYIREQNLRVHYSKKWDFVWPTETIDREIRSVNDEFFIAELPGHSNPLTLLFRWIEVAPDQSPDGVQIFGRCLKRTRF